MTRTSVTQSFGLFVGGVALTWLISPLFVDWLSAAMRTVSSAYDSYHTDFDRLRFSLSCGLLIGICPLLSRWASRSRFRFLSRPSSLFVIGFLVALAASLYVRSELRATADAISPPHLSGSLPQHTGTSLSFHQLSEMSISGIPLLSCGVMTIFAILMGFLRACHPEDQLQPP